MVSAFCPSLPLAVGRFCGRRRQQKNTARQMPGLGRVLQRGTPCVSTTARSTAGVIPGRSSAVRIGPRSTAPGISAFDITANVAIAGEVQWDRSIRVPFAPETPASGIGDTVFFRACWYRRTFRAAAHGAGERLLLHFGAVDYGATVWVNGAAVSGSTRAATRRSSSTSRRCSLDGREHEIVVRADDDPHDLAKPRGKQDWQLEPHSIWYPRTTGIWQTVWLETRPRDLRSAACAGRPNLERWEIGFEALARGRAPRRPAAAASSSAAGDTAARRRHLHGRRRRGAPPHRAVRPRHRRLPQRAALEPRHRRR